MPHTEQNISLKGWGMLMNPGLILRFLLFRKVNGPKKHILDQLHVLMASFYQKGCSGIFNPSREIIFTYDSP